MILTVLISKSQIFIANYGLLSANSRLIGLKHPGIGAATASPSVLLQFFSQTTN
jgi:hypothetical protein